MRIGLFFGENDSQFRFQELMPLLGDQLIGYYCAEPQVDFPDTVPFSGNPLDLLADCDTALVYSIAGLLSQVPRAAIRRGINLFLADLPSFNMSQISELNNLSREINSVVEFGFSGFPIDKLMADGFDFCKPIFTDCKRSLAVGSDGSTMERMLIYDLSTLGKLQGGLIKKLRAVSFPISSLDYNLLNIRIEYANGAIICYTINRMADHEVFSLDLFGNTENSLKSFSVPPNPNSQDIDYKLSAFSPMDFIESISKGYHPNFPIQNAVEVFSLLEEIHEKLAQFS